MVQLTTTDMLTILSIVVGVVAVLLSLGLGWIHKLSSDISNLKGQFEIFEKYSPYMKRVMKIENLPTDKMSKEDIRTNLIEVLYSFNLPPISISPEDKLHLSSEEIPIVKAVGSKIDDADKYFNELIGSPETYLKLGNVANFGRNYGDAIKYYDKAIHKKLKYADAWNNKGVSLGELGKYDEALPCFDKALEIDPGNATAWNNKGVVLLRFGDYKSALEYCDKALELNPMLAEAWIDKGAALCKLSKYEEALKYADRALELNPKFEQAWINKGSVLGDLGRDEEAFECFDEAMKINSVNSNAWYGKACVESKKGDKDSAIYFLKKAVVLDKKHFKMAKSDKDFDKIRNDKRFVELLKTEKNYEG
jgi:tetratricopeptide (TPR) repeat protein